MRWSDRWCCVFAVALALIPTDIRAQTAALVTDECRGALDPAEIVEMNNDPRQGTAWPSAANLGVSSAQSAPQGTGGRGLSRGQKIALGAVVGAGVGLVVGEYWFGRGLDLPHGPDMLLGAGIGAGVGALIARVAAENKTSAPTTKGPVSVVPVLSPSHKSVFVMVVVRGHRMPPNTGNSRRSPGDD